MKTATPGVPPPTSKAQSEHHPHALPKPQNHATHYPDHRYHPALRANQMAELFQRDKSTISRHISNVFSEAELSRRGTVADFATVQAEGTRRVTRQVTHDNFDVIISVGYRVKSLRGT